MTDPCEVVVEEQAKAELAERVAAARREYEIREVQR